MNIDELLQQQDIEAAGRLPAPGELKEKALPFVYCAAGSVAQIIKAIGQDGNDDAESVRVALQILGDIQRQLSENCPEDTDVSTTVSTSATAQAQSTGSGVLALPPCYSCIITYNSCTLPPVTCYSNYLYCKNHCVP